MQGNPNGGMKFEYAYDDIGNRTETKRNDQASLDAAYTPNTLNQYQSRVVPGAVEINGLAVVGGTTKVNGTTLAKMNPTSDNEFEKRYFHGIFPVANENGPTVDQFTVETEGPVIPDDGSQNTATSTGTVMTPARNESFTYDADGNLKSDGRFNYVWDAENRLIEASTLATWPVEVRVRVKFDYDHMGRRIRKIVENAVPGGWAETKRQTFVYDGWNLIGQTTTPSADPTITANSSHLGTSKNPDFGQ